MFDCLSGAAPLGRVRQLAARINQVILPPTSSSRSRRRGPRSGLALLRRADNINSGAPAAGAAGESTANAAAMHL